MRNRMKWHVLNRGWIAILTIGLLLSNSLAHAQVEIPFRISGGGIAPVGLPRAIGDENAKPHFATGVATHLGRYSGGGMLKLDSIGFSGEFGSAEPFIFTAANGDKLATHYGNKDFGAESPGAYSLTLLGGTPESPLVSAVFIAEFVVQPNESTGRFAGATGSWIMIARTGPFRLFSNEPIPYTWEGEGRIRMRRR